MNDNSSVTIVTGSCAMAQENLSHAFVAAEPSNSVHNTQAACAAKEGWVK
jgi:hypothetical protein